MSVTATTPVEVMSSLPHFHLLCMHAAAATAFTAAVTRHPTIASKIAYTIHESALSTLPSTINFDLIVSPANSYGLLDGGFDDAISRAFSPKDDYIALTRHVQAELYREYKGYLPPGMCHIVRMVDEWKGSWISRSRLRYGDGKGWNCKWLAMVPTMRVPVKLCEDEEIVYRCIWAMLAAIDRHNRVMDEADQIRSILMTPLGTGVGGLSNENWAEQCVLVMKHFIEAQENQDIWSKMDWASVSKIADEIDATKPLTP